MKWAQRSDKVYLTVILPDAKDPKVKVEPDGKFVFTASGYELDFDLFEGVNVEVNAAFYNALFKATYVIACGNVVVL